MPDKEIRFGGNRVIGPGGGKPRPYISNVGVTLAVTRYCRPASTSPPPAHIVLYITDSVLFQPLPVGFVRHLFRVVTYPGGSPLKIRTASTSSTVASSYSPAHALLVVTTFLNLVYHYLCEIRLLANLCIDAYHIPHIEKETENDTSDRCHRTERKRVSTSTF